MVVKFEEKLVETKQGTLMPVQVVPEGKRFVIIGFDEWTGSLKIRLRAKAEKGKANQELVKEMRQFFGASVELKKGEKQRQKTLLIRAKKALVLLRLSSL